MTREHSAKKLFILGHEVTPIIVGGRIAAVDVTVTPHMPGPPPHHHVDSDEFFYMVDGDPNKARGYFKDIDGAVVDEFTVTSQ